MAVARVRDLKVEMPFLATGYPAAPPPLDGEIVGTARLLVPFKLGRLVTAYRFSPGTAFTGSSICAERIPLMTAALNPSPWPPTGTAVTRIVSPGRTRSLSKRTPASTFPPRFGTNFGSVCGGGIGTTGPV
jgi:hypothetical protein